MRTGNDWRMTADRPGQTGCRWIVYGVCFLCLGAWAGCADPETEQSLQQTDSALADSSDAGAGPAEGLPVSADTTAPRTPFGSLADQEPTEAELRTYPLRIVNRFSSRVLVYASAGAGRVVLDTVPAQDSVRIDVQVRAEHVLLEVTDPSGRSLLQHDLALIPDTLNRWVAAPQSGAARTGSL